MLCCFRSEVESKCYGTICVLKADLQSTLRTVSRSCREECMIPVVGMRFPHRPLDRRSKVLMKIETVRCCLHYSLGFSVNCFMRCIFYESRRLIHSLFAPCIFCGFCDFHQLLRESLLVPKTGTSPTFSFLAHQCSRLVSGYAQQNQEVNFCSPKT